MILTKNELNLIKPALALVQENNNLEVTVTICGHVKDKEPPRDVTVDISASGVAVKNRRPTEGPQVEYHRSPMGLAMAYKVPLASIATPDDGE